MNAIWTLLASTLALTAPLALASMGGFASERGGVINIALEGKMLVAAIATALASVAWGNPWLGLGAGIVAAVMLSWTHWLLTQRFRMDHIVSGMAVNAFALGVASFLDKRYTNPQGSALPALAPVLFYSIAFLAPFLLGVYMASLRGGLHLLAVGSDPERAREMGLFPARIRFVGLTATGVFCGLAGTLIVTNAGYYTDNMTAGRGYIALAALILGGWRPIWTLIACIGFGFFQALELQLQGTRFFGAEVPREVWYSLPYIVTIIALAGIWGKVRPPAGLGKV